MKKLIFVRHSKAEDPAIEISDFERSLTSKGKILANTMAIRLKEKESSAGILISSPAFRAIETALIFAGIFRLPADKILLAGNIYYKFNFLTLQSELKRINEEEDIVTLFGHNPSFTDLAAELSREGCDFIQKCGIVCISFQAATWSDLKPNSGKIEYNLKP
ncbi:MAG TPA: histidine phosphatase family protein [Bacteroidales bacterium]|nr:histidine phosphatase family protein [Bacteroidales bacterium]